MEKKINKEPFLIFTELALPNPNGYKLCIYKDGTALLRRIGYQDGHIYNFSLNSELVSLLEQQLQDVVNKHKHDAVIKKMNGVEWEISIEYRNQQASVKRIVCRNVLPLYLEKIVINLEKIASDKITKSEERI